MRLASSAIWISTMMLSCILINSRAIRGRFKVSLTCHAIKAHEQLSSVKFGWDFHLLCVKKWTEKLTYPIVPRNFVLLQCYQM